MGAEGSNFSESQINEHFKQYNYENDFLILIPMFIKIKALFLNDGLSGCSLQIKGDDVNLKNNPWEENNSNTQVLEKGKMIIFADKNKPLYVENQTKKPYYINCEKGEEINSDNYEEIIGKEKLSNMFQKLRMNKILNTNESNNENKLITNYFKNLSQFTKRGNNSEILNI
jgi:hypothetical protein